MPRTMPMAAASAMPHGARKASATPIMRTLHINALAPAHQDVVGAIAHLPARFPGFDECVLHHVVGFVAILQRAKRNGKKWMTHFSNDQFKSFEIAVNGSSIHFMVGGLHWCDQSLDG